MTIYQEEGGQKHTLTASLKRAFCLDGIHTVGDGLDADASDTRICLKRMEVWKDPISSAMDLRSVLG